MGKPKLEALPDGSVDVDTIKYGWLRPDGTFLAVTCFGDHYDTVRREDGLTDGQASRAGYIHISEHSWSAYSDHTLTAAQVAWLRMHGFHIVPDCNHGTSDWGEDW